MARKEKDGEALTMGDIERALVRLARRVDQPKGMDPIKANCLRSIYQVLADIKRDDNKTWWQSRVGVLYEEFQRRKKNEGAGALDS